MSQAANAGHLKAMEAMVALSSGAEQQQWQLKLAQAKTTDGDQSDRDMFQMASTFLANQQYEQALTWYRKLAAKGNPSAQKTVLQLTDATAVRLRTSADNGDVNAMFQLGEYFRSGDWQGRDDKQALEWYLKATDKGHSASAYQAALLTTSEWDKRELMYKARNLGNKEAERCWRSMNSSGYRQASAFASNRLKSNDSNVPPSRPWFHVLIVKAPPISMKSTSTAATAANAALNFAAAPTRPRSSATAKPKPPTSNAFGMCTVAVPRQSSDAWKECAAALNVWRKNARRRTDTTGACKTGITQATVDGLF